MVGTIDEARKVAIALLDDLEGGEIAIDGILLKAKRLARLMRDTDSQRWLDLEMSGYPDGFYFSQLGTCEKYAVAGGRLKVEEGKYYKQSLPELEANSISDEAFLRAHTTASPPAKVKDYLEKRATEEFIVGQINIQVKRKEAFAQSKSLFVAMKSAIHSYATDSFLAIELGDIAQDVFEAARNDVDAFIRAHCPKAAEKLIAINERMADHSPESRTAALTSCRRLLMTVADSLFPPQAEDWKDSKGKSRKVGEEQHKNRLLAYLSDLNQSQGSREIIESELEHLAARLDAIYEKTCKGVHVDVSEQEARLAVIHTYLFVAELASGDAETNTADIRERQQ
ncbi:MAG: hypothetical protein WAL80_16465 [Xanthobacteraceae bacterium]